MSKTVDELIMVFEKARAEAAPFPQHHEDGLYAGIAAVVRAVRDELSMSKDINSCSACDANYDLFHEILGDAVEKVAGGLPDDAVPIPLMHPESAISAPATDAAPAVCVWTGEEYVTHSTSCESEHEVDPHKAPPVHCPSCGKPIKFTEVK